MPHRQSGDRKGAAGGREPRLGQVAEGCGWALLALVGLFGGGCAGDATGPRARHDVTLHAFLYVGEGVTADNAIHLGRVGAIDAAYDPNVAAVDDARVFLRKEGEARADTLFHIGSGAYANAAIQIEPRSTYHLRAEFPDGDSLTASTTTPESFTASAGPPVVPDSVPYAALDSEHPIEVQCSDSSQIFLCDVYCLDSWSDVRYINPFGDHDRPDDDEEYGGDNGEPRHIFAFFRIGDVVRSPNGWYRIDFYAAMMAFYGHYDVNILAIDRNTYRWLYQDHPEESGGVRGGLGVFGSATRRTWSVEATE